MSDIDDIVKRIQSDILQQLKKEYSAKFIRHWQQPKNWGIMHDADGYGKVTGPCGDTMEISLTVKNDRIMKCTYDTDGCGTTIACGSIITEMAKGKNIHEAKAINQQTILDYCGGLPDADQHCALLAAQTLQQAIADYKAVKTEPWKKLYRKK
jgi:nitrogen fixation NifU-like protein